MTATMPYICLICHKGKLFVMVHIKGDDNLGLTVCKKCWKQAEKIHQLNFELKI